MKWPTKFPDDLSPHQVEQLQRATTHSLGVLGGSPGTGKTYTAARLIRAVGQVIGFDQIAAACPTGKAAVRLTEALNGEGLPIAAKTIHSLLQVEQGGEDGGWRFAHDRNNPLPFKVLVFDEFSMCDVDLAASLFAARARGTLVLIIGDVNQLPPVGHGAPLRDMIAAGVPYGELREIKRQQSEGGRVHAVIQACADIRDGKPFQCREELRHINAPSAAYQVDAMVDTVNRSARELGVHPVWGVQVLCAVNSKSELSRKELNRVLQAQLNPMPAEHGSPFRVNDKVVNTKNGYFPLVEAPPKVEDVQLNKDGKAYSANGELGEVMLVESKFLHVRLSAPDRFILVPRGEADVNDDNEKDDEASGTGCNWDLGYALSVHKFQGSEIPVAVVMIDESAKRVCSREWIYTALSRGKQQVYLIGKLSVAHAFCKRTAIDKRKTFLKEKIQQCLSGPKF
jgi:exodeoxyribonuclease V alpha subunit